MKPTIALSLSLLLTACAAQPAATLPPAEPATQALATQASATQPAATEETVSAPPFDAAVYTDAENGFHLSYPVGWMVDGPISGGSRGGYVQITSWQHDPGGFDSVPAGETVLQIATYLWDPKGDLDARLQQRRTAFEASGMTILDEQSVTFSSGQPGVRMLIEGPNGEISPWLFATLGDDYLEISGNGDVELLNHILDTFDFN